MCYNKQARQRDFNPRPREEGDRIPAGMILIHAYFNPRPREEGDATILSIKSFVAISIHALVKRATMVWLANSRYHSYFNPRPREEGDESLIKTGWGEGISIHALVKRATARFNTLFTHSFISIHALVKRATKTISR